MSETRSFPRVERIRSLLGDKAVLLAWPMGSKGTAIPWKRSTVANTTTPAYNGRLENGNIGVVLGEKSAGLCSIDWDDDSWVERFLELNPALHGSLRTRGRRGCNVWVRCTGAFPSSGKFKDKFLGSACGEWRANNNQTIISGTHPETQKPYTFLVEAPPVEIAFEDIVWPDGLDLPWQKTCEQQELIVHSHTATHATQASQKTHPRSPAAAQVTQGTQDVVLPPLFRETVFEVSPFVPTERGQSDRLLFAMARRLKTWEKQAGRKTTRDEQTALFDAWWPLAQPHIDPALDYFAFQQKWFNTYRRAKYADNETPVQAAWALVMAKPLPPEATRRYGPQPIPLGMQRLIALCYHLQRGQGEKPFHLGSRDAEKLLGIAHTTVFYWLECLRDADGVFRLLKKVSVGSKAARLTNEWIFLPLLKLEK